jgi:hypothetical protein
MTGGKSAAGTVCARKDIFNFLDPGVSFHKKYPGGNGQDYCSYQTDTSKNN